MYRLSSKTKKLVLGERTVLMGVLNITPDSFSDGGRYMDVAAAVSRGEEMVNEGADIIDVGGESTRPGSDSVTMAEEITRVIPVVRALREKLGEAVWISVDTNKAAVAEAALTAGADMLNILGGLRSGAGLAEVIKKYQCPFVVYHINGTPKTMQEGIVESADVVAEVKDFFTQEIAECERAGLARALLVLDPGIGFGKTVGQNIEMLERLGEFAEFDCPILIGVSRKSHLGAILKEQLHLAEAPAPLERIEAGLAETSIAVGNGAHIIRTHDVAATKKFLATLDYVRAITQ